MVDTRAARLDGTAYRLLRERADRDTCIREIQAITTDPVVLATAAGQALGGHRAMRHDADRVARMILAAGADPDLTEQIAAETEARLLVDQRRPGIGMPG